MAVVEGFHGCGLVMADAVNTGVRLSPSDKPHEWLGPGVYFWVNGFKRAISWAQDRHKEPAVVKGIIDLGNCLNLTDTDHTEEMKDAYDYLEACYQKAGRALPKNSREINGVPTNRKLDCKVIKWVNNLRDLYGYDAYDTVLGAFEEGVEIYPGAALKNLSHVQVAVINYKCIMHLEKVWPEHSVLE